MTHGVVQYDGEGDIAVNVDRPIDKPIVISNNLADLLRGLDYIGVSWSDLARTADESIKAGAVLGRLIIVPESAGVPASPQG